MWGIVEVHLLPVGYEMTAARAGTLTAALWGTLNPGTRLSCTWVLTPRKCEIINVILSISLRVICYVTNYIRGKFKLRQSGSGHHGSASVIYCSLVLGISLSASLSKASICNQAQCSPSCFPMAQVVLWFQKTAQIISFSCNERKSSCPLTCTTRTLSIPPVELWLRNTCSCHHFIYSLCVSTFGFFFLVILCFFFAFLCY